FRPDIVHVFNFFPLLSPSIHYACQEADVPIVQKISNFRLICPSALLQRDGHACEECMGKLIPWPGVLHACYRDSRAGSSVVAAREGNRDAAFRMGSPRGLAALP